MIRPALVRTEAARSLALMNADRLNGDEREALQEGARRMLSGDSGR